MPAARRAAVQQAARRSALRAATTPKGTTSTRKNRKPTDRQQRLSSDSVSKAGARKFCGPRSYYPKQRFGRPRSAVRRRPGSSTRSEELSGVEPGRARRLPKTFRAPAKGIRPTRQNSGAKSLHKTPDAKHRAQNTRRETPCHNKIPARNARRKHPTKDIRRTRPPGAKHPAHKTADTKRPARIPLHKTPRDTPLAPTAGSNYQKRLPAPRYRPRPPPRRFGHGMRRRPDEKRRFLVKSENNYYLCEPKGEVQEWLNWPAWKASKPLKGFRGSNPLLSAKGPEGLVRTEVRRYAADFFIYCAIPLTPFRSGASSNAGASCAVAGVR